MKVNEVRLQWRTEEIPSGVTGAFRIIGTVEGREVSTNWIDLGSDVREQLLINRMTQSNGDILRQALALILKKGDPEPVSQQPAATTISDSAVLITQIEDLASNHSPKGALNRLKAIAEVIEKAEADSV